MDSDSLSSLENSDDECSLHDTRRSTLVVLTITPVVVLLNILPSKEEKSLKRGVIRYEEAEIQTDEGHLKNLDEQTETISLQTTDVGVFADLPSSSKSSFQSEESALEVLLRHLSLVIHRPQLEQWLLDNPTEEASFSIKPVVSHTQRILRATYNTRFKTFVLLLQSTSGIFLEIRSFSNLLKSTAVPVTEFSEENDYRLQSEADLISVLGPSFLSFYSIKDLIIKYHTSRSDVISPFFLDSSFGFCTSNGEIFLIEEDNVSLLCRLSPLLLPISFSFSLFNRLFVLSSSGLSIVHPSSPLQYESFPFLSTGRHLRVISSLKGRITVFDKKNQTCWILDEEKPREAQQTLHFGQSEYTVDVAVQEAFLFSLTSGGSISRWRLQSSSTRRLIREQVLNTQLPNCKRLLQVGTQKFAVQTSSRIHFVIFSRDSIINE